MKEEYGKAAYDAAREMNYRYTEEWENLPQEGKDYWTAIANAVLEAAKFD
jgi:hypothetical protein